jgi:hypothetical protein
MRPANLLFADLHTDQIGDYSKRAARTLQRLLHMGATLDQHHRGRVHSEERRLGGVSTSN